MEVRYRVHFYDTDTMGVVHHSNYIRWFEIGRVEYLRAIGIDLNEMMKDGITFPITEVSAKYKASAKFDDIVTIETKAVELTKVKMKFTYSIKREAEILVSGATQNVFTDIKSGKIIRLPDKYYELLQKTAK